VVNLLKIVPARLRRYAADRLPDRHVDTLRTALGPGGLTRPIRRAAQHRITRAGARTLLSVDAGLVVRHLGSRAWVCRLDDDVTANSAQTRNLALVCDTLAAAGVTHWVRDTRGHKSAVVVPAAERDTAVRALRDAHTGSAVYLGELTRPSRTAKLAGSSGSATFEAGIRVFAVYLSRTGTLFMGAAHACDVEFWTGNNEGHALVAPRANTTVTRIPHAEVSPATVPVSGRDLPSLPAFTTTGVFDVTFPVDAVYTWVDGSDEKWRERKRRAWAAHTGVELHSEAANDSRYETRDELRYSLRSLETFAPFIRNIYLVTDDQVPSWLDTSNPRITVVSHRDLFGDFGTLPTFNSHAIETRLHKIPGLAEHYLYMNDDVLFGRPVTAETFFHANGLAKFFWSNALVDAGARTPADPPVMTAAKNNRDLLAAEFGRHVRNKMKHTPHPQRRSVLEALETAHPDIFKQTASHQFRHPDDYSIPSALQPYYSYLTGNAVPGSIRYSYISLCAPDTGRRLRNLLNRRDMDVFCVNDTDVTAEQMPAVAQTLRSFLQAYLPNPSSFELPGH
jgi:hypothetical protein